MYSIEIITCGGGYHSILVEGCEAAWSKWNELLHAMAGFARLLLVAEDTGEIIADSEGK